MSKKKKTGFFASIMAGVKAGIEEALNEFADSKSKNPENTNDPAKTDNSKDSSSSVSDNKRSINIKFSNKTNKDDKSAAFEEIGKNNPQQTVEIKMSLASALKGLGQILASSDVVETVKDKTFRSIKRLERLTGHEIKKMGESRKFAKLGFRVRGTKLLSCNRNDAFIEIPDGITEIGASAFSNNEFVNHITLPDSINRIGAFAFCGCTNLKQINIPEGVTEIGECAFQACTSIKSLALPKSVIHIGQAAFSACTSMVKLELPHRLDNISDELCAYCISLSEVRWPDNVKNFGNDIFLKCCLPEAPLDYFELKDNILQRIHIDIDEWSEQNGSLTCGSRIVSRTLLDVFYCLYGHFLTSDIHRNGEYIIYYILRIVEFITDNDPYAMMHALENIQKIIANADRFDWETLHDRQLILFNILMAIGGNGSDYRVQDELWKEKIKTLWNGNIKDVLGTFDESVEDIPENVDNYIFQNDETDELLVVSPEDNAQKGKQHLSPEEIESYVLWLHALEDMNAAPSTNRYNPRVYHYSSSLGSGYDYWKYVDSIEGLIRGAGYERVRFSPANISEDDPVDSWSEAWSRAMADQTTVDDETLTITRYRYFLKFRKSEDNPPEFYDVYMVMKRCDALKLREMLVNIALDAHLKIWCNGEEIRQLRVI